MKIWMARLRLAQNDESEYEVKFNFELEDGDYQYMESQGEWTKHSGWLHDYIPSKITILSSYSVNAIQGFDRELTEDELKDVKQKMKEKIAIYLCGKQNKINEEYNNKLHAVANMAI